MKHGTFFKPQPLHIVVDEFGPHDARVRARWIDPPDDEVAEEVIYTVEVRVTDRMIRPSFGMPAKAAYTVDEIGRVIEILTRARDRAIGLRKPNDPAMRLVGRDDSTISETPR